MAHDSGCQYTANALITGEIDWIEMPVPDLLPMMRRAGAVTERLDDWGFISQLRPNHLIAPTSNVGVRRAMMAAISQRDVMEALMGGDPDGWMVPVGYLITGKPEVDQAGIENVSEPQASIR